MFSVTKEIRFCYGHRLLNYDGKCRYLHGHNGRAVITLAAEDLDNLGMVMDFSRIKSVLRAWIDANLDHRMILHKDDPILPALKQQGEPLFIVDVNPTAENIAKLIFDFTAGESFPVVEVCLWETDDSYAVYKSTSPLTKGGVIKPRVEVLRNPRVRMSQVPAGFGIPQPAAWGRYKNYAAL